MTKSVVLIANGEFIKTERIMDIIHLAEFKIAVDGGDNHMKSLGIIPDIIIGDLDSIDLKRLKELEELGVEIKKYNVHKDETDLELAVEYVLETGFEQITILGATGGRIDHFVGNLFLLSNPIYDHKEIKFLTDQEEIFYCNNNQEIIGNPGDLVSLIPISDQVTGVITEGLDYPLNDESLFRWKSRGISNQMSTFIANIRFDTGNLLCIHRYSTNSESR